SSAPSQTCYFGRRRTSFGHLSLTTRDDMAIWSTAASRAGASPAHHGAAAGWANRRLRMVTAYGYPFAVSLAAAGAIVLLPGTAPSSEPIFAPLALALFVGFL